MSPVKLYSKLFFNYSVSVLNQPNIKEGIKTVAGSVTFMFGLLEIYNLYRITKGDRSVFESFKDYPKWQRVSLSVIIVCSKISIILSAGVSKPGLFIITSLFGQFFSSEQIEGVFGPNTIFEINPWHPRHITSIVSVALAMPFMMLNLYQGVSFVCRRINVIKNIQEEKIKNLETDFKIKSMAYFSFLTSRPILHLGNQFVRAHTRLVIPF